MLEEDDVFLSPHIPDGLLAEAVLGEFMRTVIVSVESEGMDFPLTDPDGGNWRIAVTGPTNETQDVAEPTATFTLQAGDYTAVAVRLSTDGTTLIGPTATANFTVVDLFKKVDVAKTVTVVFQ